MLLSCVNPTRYLLQDLKIECLTLDFYRDNQSTVYFESKTHVTLIHNIWNCTFSLSRWCLITLCLLLMFLLRTSLQTSLPNIIQAQILRFQMQTQVWQQLSVTLRFRSGDGGMLKYIVSAVWFMVCTIIERHGPIGLMTRSLGPTHKHGI